MFGDNHGDLLMQIGRIIIGIDCEIDAGAKVPVIICIVNAGQLIELFGKGLFALLESRALSGVTFGIEKAEELILGYLDRVFTCGDFKIEGHVGSDDVGDTCAKAVITFFVGDPLHEGHQEFGIMLAHVDGVAKNIVDKFDVLCSDFIAAA